MWKESFRVLYTSESLQTLIFENNFFFWRYLRFWQISFHSFPYSSASQPGERVLQIPLQAVVVIIYLIASILYLFCSQHLNKARIFFTIEYGTRKYHSVILLSLCLEGGQIPVKGAPYILVVADSNVMHINCAVIIIKSLYFLDFWRKNPFGLLNHITNSLCGRCFGSLAETRWTWLRNAVAWCKVVSSEGIIFPFLQFCNDSLAIMQAKFEFKLWIKFFYFMCLENQKFNNFLGHGFVTGKVITKFRDLDDRNRTYRKHECSPNHPECHWKLKNKLLQQFHFAWTAGWEQIVSLLLICFWPKQRYSLQNSCH